MKKLLIAFCICIGAIAQAAVVVVNTPGVTLTAGQPINAVFTDANGNTYEQQVYYDAAAGGIEVGNTGNYASVYFPILGTGYLAYNGFWVGQDGYYWNNGARVYVGPHWNGYWNDHWHGGWHSGYDNHYDVHVDNHYNNYRGGDWHGEDHHDNWHGGGHEEWRGGGGHEEFHGGGHRR